MHSGTLAIETILEYHVLTGTWALLVFLTGCPSAVIVSGTDGSGCKCGVRSLCLQAELRAEPLNAFQTAWTHFNLFLWFWALWTSLYAHGILSAFSGAAVGGLAFSALW